MNPVCVTHPDTELRDGFEGFRCPLGCADQEAGRRFRTTELTSTLYRSNCYSKALREHPGDTREASAARRERYLTLVGDVQ